MSKNLAIGIDLGTTYSCVGVYYNNTVKILPNNEGKTITPSYVAFNDLEVAVGEDARNAMLLNSANTVYDVKRLIGRNFDDPTVQEDMKTWSFEVVNVRDKVKIQVTFKDEQRTFYPEEISSLVLKKMKQTAEAFLGFEIANAVITVPAYFNDSQRQTTKDAGSIAGLKVLRIINEPTAACLAYGFDEINNGNTGVKRILVYDLGGGTFDISILAVENGIFDVIAVAGDTHLGGQDFDNRLIFYLVDEFQRKHKLDIKNNKRALTKLRLICERTKRTLSNDMSANVVIESLFQGIDFQTQITRTRFENLNIDLFEKTINCVQKALADAKLSVNDINDIILVGGSTRIPKIRKLLEQFFGRTNLIDRINVDEAVAYGAAVNAAILMGDISDDAQAIKVHDVTPFSLGIETSDENSMSVIIKRNTPIPAGNTKNYTTGFNYQTEAMISVFEGESVKAPNNNLLGEFVIMDIPRNLAGHETCNVTFQIDENGILNVTAVNTSNGAQNNIIIDKKHLDVQELTDLIAEANELPIADPVCKREDKHLITKNNLQVFCDRIKVILDVRGDVKPCVDLLSKYNETVMWMEQNPDAKDEEYEQKLNELNVAMGNSQEIKEVLLDDENTPD